MFRYTLIFIVFILFGCNNNDKKWYSGGKLHDASIDEWKISTVENKLATCADFVAGTSENSGVQISEDDLKTLSLELMNCIDNVCNNSLSEKKNSVNQSVVEIAAGCMTFDNAGIFKKPTD